MSSSVNHGKGVCTDSVPLGTRMWQRTIRDATRSGMSILESLSLSKHSAIDEVLWKPIPLCVSPLTSIVAAVSTQSGSPSRSFSGRRSGRKSCRSPEFSEQPNKLGLVAVRNNGWGDRHFYSIAARFAAWAAAFYRELIVGSGFRESDAGCGAIPCPSKSTAARFSFARN